MTTDNLPPYDLVDELSAHLDYLEERNFIFDEIARDALFAQLADERGITTKEVNHQLCKGLMARIQRTLSGRT